MEEGEQMTCEKRQRISWTTRKEVDDVDDVDEMVEEMVEEVVDEMVVVVEVEVGVEVVGR